MPIALGPYHLVNLPTGLISEESPWETNDELIAEHTKTLQSNPTHQRDPIIAPFSQSDEIADAWHRALAYKAAGRETIPAYIPIKSTNLKR